MTHRDRLFWSERLSAILKVIEDGATRREEKREIPTAEIEALRRVGFTAITVPREFGGAGLGADVLVGQLIDLACADSNVAQALRSHFVLIERLVVEPVHPWRSRWLTEAGRGVIFGNASQELSSAAPGSHTTVLRRVGERLLLNGTKYYSTGSLTADWLSVVARNDAAQIVQVLVDSNAAGVQRVDDWDGFGQRLSGSGTTHFRDVAVDPDNVLVRGNFAAPSYATPFAQLVLLASLAGVAKAALRDATAYVRRRSRVYTHGSGRQAAADPLVQQVIGRAASSAFAVEAAVLAAADAVQEARVNVVDARVVEAAELAVVKAQVAIIPMVLEVSSEIFEVGGASATSSSIGLDRHWRNARTLASHNPAIYQARAIGDHLVNDSELTHSWATGESSA